MVMMVLSGAGLGIILKLMNTLEIKGEPFEHPFFQSIIMFIGESLCMIIYLIEKYKIVRTYGNVQASPAMIKAVEEGMKTNINPLLFAIPMFCDATASSLLLIAYINVPASVAQMMGGLVVFIVAIMSIIFLKRKLYRHHWTGLVLIFAGIAMVAATALMRGNQGGGDGNVVLGISMMCGSIVIQGCQYIVEEKLLGSYYVSPMKAVGWEGIFGTILFAILLVIFQYVPCGAEICSRGVIEDSRFALQQMFASTELFIYVVANIFLVGGMNGLGLIVTKYASSANRVTLQQTKVFLVWLFFLLLPVRGREKFSFLQLGGFVVIIMGVILYNEILELPILGFNMYTKSALERRKLRAKSLNPDDQDAEHYDEEIEDVVTQDATNYQPTSPSRYDYQRNYNRLKHHMEDKAGKSTQNGAYMKMDGFED